MKGFEMKNYLLLLLLLLVFVISSCDKGCTPESESFEILGNSEITLEQLDDQVFYSVEEGNQRVVVYNHSNEECKDVIDDEYSEWLSFELTADGDQFEYHDEEITQLKAFYREVGAWVSHVHYPINSGVIKGQRIGDSEDWQITIDIELTTANSTKSINIANTFIMK